MASFEVQDLRSPLNRSEVRLKGNNHGEYIGETGDIYGDGELICPPLQTVKLAHPLS